MRAIEGDEMINSMFDRIVFAAQMAWIRFKSWFRPAYASGATAYKIYAFNETTGGNFHEIFPAKRCDLESIRAKLDWEKYRIEMRYTFHGKKYRAIYRHDDEETFPPKRGMTLVVAPKMTAACLIRRADGKQIDVTDRIRKYLGPDRDFHSKKRLYVRVQDMFPFDDHDDNSERFEALGLWFSTGKYMEFKYEDNDVVVI